MNVSLKVKQMLPGIYATRGQDWTANHERIDGNDNPGSGSGGRLSGVFSGLTSRPR